MLFGGAEQKGQGIMAKSYPLDIIKCLFRCGGFKRLTLKIGNGVLMSQTCQIFLTILPNYFNGPEVRLTISFSLSFMEEQENPQTSSSSLPQGALSSGILDYVSDQNVGLNCSVARKVERTKVGVDSLRFIWYIWRQKEEVELLHHELELVVADLSSALGILVLEEF
ncbi:hypothetical protein Prudu_008660 [Prunus dulcis]|uniref:Uncharacterized protein n=1 Tax=Prunus dulcis TaxID=3755 RepID=A0A4Y1R4L1_PRUDU|nr:hypothetical protein Prudu_008660 [Prunus dulcis]